MMQEIAVYLVLGLVNLPFALQKKNKYRGLSWFVFGFNIGLAVATFAKLI
jgi:hypothetical protein